MQTPTDITCAARPAHPQTCTSYTNASTSLHLSNRRGVEGGGIGDHPAIGKYNFTNVHGSRILQSGAAGRRLWLHEGGGIDTAAQRRKSYREENHVNCGRVKEGHHGSQKLNWRGCSNCVRCRGNCTEGPAETDAGCMEGGDQLAAFKHWQDGHRKPETEFLKSRIRLNRNPWLYTDLAFF